MSANRLAKQISSEYITASTHFVSPKHRGVRRVMVYVEGYEDISGLSQNVCFQQLSEQFSQPK